jgi:hypothetical protein
MLTVDHHIIHEIAQNKTTVQKEKKQNGATDTERRPSSIARLDFGE